ncbi:MAG: hypothetical protein LBJ00_10845 [Planctomycetaceae bacterium]|nr:hypothetical protein [Planctomycetaceae bacterium]
MMRYLTFSILLLFVVGCGNVPLSGRVTFTDNGDPLGTGTICFVSGNQQATGKIDVNGYYKVNFGTKSGIPKGEYKVCIQEADQEEAVQMGKIVLNPVTGKNEPETFIKRTPLIAAKYANVETSGLEFTVDGKNKTFDIAVDRPDTSTTNSTISTEGE